MASVEFGNGSAEVFGILQEQTARDLGVDYGCGCRHASGSPKWNVESGDKWMRIVDSSIRQPLWTVKDVRLRDEYDADEYGPPSAFANLYLEVEAACTQNPYRVYVKAFCPFPRSETPPHASIQSIQPLSNTLWLRAVRKAFIASSRDSAEANALVHPWILRAASHWPLIEGADFVLSSCDSDSVIVRLSPRLFTKLPDDVYGIDMDDENLVLWMEVDASACSAMSTVPNAWFQGYGTESCVWHDTFEWSIRDWTQIQDKEPWTLHVFAHSFPPWPEIDETCFARLKQLEQEDDRLSDKFCERLSKWFPYVNE